MVESSVNQIIKSIDSMIALIKDDISDLKSGDSVNVLKRDDTKKVLVEEISSGKSKLDKELLEIVKSGADIEPYRAYIDTVESKLKELHKTNSDLAYILLPLKEMYDGIVEDFFRENHSAVDLSV